MWHAAWQRSGPNAMNCDFNNQFGWHALPVNDPIWRSVTFREQWMQIAASGCRGADDTLSVASGPLNPSSVLKIAVERVLPSNHELIAVSGSGTEAVSSFYDIANAFLTAQRGLEAGRHADDTAVTNAQLLFFRGCYVGGAHALQAASGVDVIAEQAFAPTGVPDACLIEGAPYTHEALGQIERVLESRKAAATLDLSDGGGGGAAVASSNGCGGSAAALASGKGCDGAAGSHLTAGEVGCLTAGEVGCLERIDATIDLLRGRGQPVGGIVVEVVPSHVGGALSPAFLSALRALTRARRVLLFEDAVMTGLRCGTALLGEALLPGDGPDFVAIGKAFGFSGVVARRASAEHLPGVRPQVMPGAPPIQRLFDAQQRLLGIRRRQHVGVLCVRVVMQLRVQMVMVVRVVRHFR